jgi:succinate-semialdehyde dehydrogenase/glutarate-semialdehyde dehydrogenase
LSNGAPIVVGGNRHERRGTFFQPTLLTGAHSGMRLAREETFGPVAAVFRFDEEADVVTAANDTESGLTLVERSACSKRSTTGWLG